MIQSNEMMVIGTMEMGEVLFERWSKGGIELLDQEFQVEGLFEEMGIGQDQRHEMMGIRRMVKDEKIIDLE